LGALYFALQLGWLKKVEGSQMHPVVASYSCIRLHCGHMPKACTHARAHTLHKCRFTAWAHTQAHAPDLVSLTHPAGCPEGFHIWDTDPGEQHSKDRGPASRRVWGCRWAFVRVDEPESAWVCLKTG